MTIGPQGDAEAPDGGAGDDLAALLRARRGARRGGVRGALPARPSAKLYGVVARILTRGDASGEALQEAYVRIWEKAGDFDPAKGSPLAWMATIARNRALDEVRRVRPASLEDMPEGFEPAAEDGRSAGGARRARSGSRRCSPASSVSTRRSAKRCCSPIIAASAARRWRSGSARRRATIKTWLRRSLTQLRDCLAS